MGTFLLLVVEATKKKKTSFRVLFQDMLDVGMRLAVPAKTVLTILLDSSPLAVVQEVNKKLAFEYDTKGILGYMPPEVIQRKRDNNHVLSKNCFSVLVCFCVPLAGR